MSIIKVLSNVEAKKIAAGEVVERPASVVKELFENSIDAGASKISLFIESAGKKLIRVIDNGCGMHPIDARLCFENHATSKITSLDDLNKIATFGFRGEALASISSVSKIEMQTKCSDSEDELGISLSFIDGAVEQEKKISCPVGTDLFIKDLFYNTPVRQKFLKQEETEWNQIQSLFQAFCLSHLAVHFQLHRDGRLVLNAPAVTHVQDRVIQLWGHNVAQNLIGLKPSEKEIRVHGLISNHNFWRYGRQHIFFFVNGRWVKNAELSKALLKGYRNVLPPAKFPAAFLFIELDNLLVDINVHPRKEEVRFAKPVTVANTIQDLVTKSLEGLIDRQLVGESLPHRHVPSWVDSISASEPIAVPEAVFHEDADEHSYVPPQPSLPQRFFQQPVQQEPFLQQNTIREIAPAEPSVGRIIGQLLDMYILIENDDGLLLIDQHAAHERILYERYLKNFEQKEGTRLLFPEIIKLSSEHLAIVLHEQAFLARQGIEVEQIGDSELAIKTSPPKVHSQSLRELIFELIAFVEQNEELDQEEFRKKINEFMHSQLACKMAIKAGDPLSHEMMRNIVLQLQQVDNRFICVHGRPTTWTISAIELEKRFRRRG